MQISLILILISLCVALIFLALFYFAFLNGQFEDLSSPPLRILFDEKNVINLNKEDVNENE